MKLSLFSLPVLFAATAFAQPVSPICAVTGVPTVIRSEGVTERMGDIVLTCSGAPGNAVSGNLTVNLATVITNRPSGSGVDVLLTLDNGAGPALVPIVATPNGNNQVSFNGLSFTVGASGKFELRVTNLRGDASLVNAQTNVTAQLAFNSPGLISTTTSNLVVGVPQRGLLASSVSALVCSQTGSPLPATLGFAEFLAAGSAFSTIRITEGFASAFDAKGPLLDTGARIVVRYNNVPSDARLFVPDSIAGSDAAVPTAAGDYGGPVSGGVYTPGSHTLFLARVTGADSNGAGGSAIPVPAPSGAFNSVTEVAIANGAGYAVYEVLDSDPQLVESAKLPTFLAVPRSISERFDEIGRDVTFGPLSTATGSVPGAPVPRFALLTPDNDCTIRGDCGSLIPKLAIPFADPLSFEVTAGLAIYRERYIYVENAGGGKLQYTPRVVYRAGQSGWLRVTPQSNSARVDIMIAGLAPGDYQADIVIDAGSAGVQTLPVSLKINPAVPALPKPAISSFNNGATFVAGPVAVGSLVTIKGSNLSGTNASVTFDGLPAKVLYSSAGQLNVQVPAQLGSRQTTSLVVTANGVASDPMTITLSPVAPGIFVPGILNQDNTANGVTNPAPTGTMVQIFATGLLLPDGTGTVEAKLHDQIYTVLPYAGPAPGIEGVQQVNLKIPDGWPTMTTEVLLCSTAGGQRVCSPPVKITIRQAQ